jgi:hypothetical protein
MAHNGAMESSTAKCSYCIATLEVYRTRYTLECYLHEPSLWNVKVSSLLDFFGSEKRFVYCWIDLIQSTDKIKIHLSVCLS